MLHTVDCLVVGELYCRLVKKVAVAYNPFNTNIVSLQVDLSLTQ